MNKFFFQSTLLITLFVLMLLSSTVYAQPTDEILKQMQTQLNPLQQRVSDLEAQNADLKEKLELRSENPSPIPASQEIQPATPDIPFALSNVTAMQGAPPMVTAKSPIELYGRLQFDASYGDSRVNEGNYVRWVESESLNKDDDEFNATMIRSRFGAKPSGPNFGNAVSTGLVEADFFGGGNDNSPRLRLRHAFMQLYYPDSDLYLLAGQTYDVFSPLFPPTVNSLTGYYAGNLGFRRTQLRVTKDFKTGNDQRLSLHGALTRNIGELNGFDPGDTVEDTGFPAVQGRIAYSMPLLTDKPATIGVSGHWGQEEYDFDAFGHHRDFDSWSVNLDLTFPLYDRIVLLAELWMGENLDNYVGGISQGVNHTLMEEVEAKGGWAAWTRSSVDAIFFCPVVEQASIKKANTNGMMEYAGFTVAYPDYLFSLRS